MWRRSRLHRAHLHRVNSQSRAIDSMSLNSSPSSPYGEEELSNKNLVANDKVVFMALGAFFGLMLLLFAIQIYVRCIWRRIQTDVNSESEDDESEEMTATDIYIREIGAGRRNWRRRLNHYFDERSERSSPAQHIPVGLDKSVLQLLPTFVFKKEAVCRDETVCAVCLEEFLDGERGRLLPKCSHSFHVQCIDMWFLSHSSCPLCRCEVCLPSPNPLLLQNGQSCPEFPPYRSEQQPQQEPQPSPPPSITELRDPALREDCPPVSSTFPDIESASIVGARDSNDALYLERGSSLAAIALEMSDHERIIGTEENQQTGSSGQQPDEVKLLVTEGSSSDIPLPGSQHRYMPPESILRLEYRPELHSATSASLNEHTAPVASSISIGSPTHGRKRSYLAVEIIGDYQLDAPGAMS